MSETISQRAMQAARRQLDTNAARDLLGVKRTALSEARVILKFATPEVLAAVEAGTLSTGAARKLLKTAPRPSMESYRKASPDATQIVNAIESMTVCADMLPAIIMRGDLASHAQAATWQKQLRKIRLHITRATRLLITKNGDLTNGQ